MTKPTIMYPSGLPFYRMRQRPQQLCIELARRGYKIIFGQALHDMGDREVFLTRGNYIKETEFENLYLCYDLGRYLREHGDDEYIILYASSGKGHRMAGIPNLDAFIYDELDNFPRNEPDARGACRKATRIMYSANSIKTVLDTRRQLYPEITGKVTYIPNATEFEHWDLPLKSVEEFSPPFKIMYVGAWAYWLDYPYIIEVVRQLPQCEFWFFGGNFNYSLELRPYVEILKASPNVKIIQHINYMDLPFFLEDADVLWIPFDVTNRMLDGGDMVFPITMITQHTNPIKFWEYLSTGKPIVHTPMNAITEFTDTLNPDDTLLSCAATADEAVKAIEGHVDFMSFMENQEKGLYHKELAKQHTWKMSADLMSGVVDDIMASDLEAEMEEKKRLIVTSTAGNNLERTSVQIPDEPEELL